MDGMLDMDRHRRCKLKSEDLEESQIQTLRLVTLAISSTEMLNVGFPSVDKAGKIFG